jgi:hypothetical protein
MSDSPYHDFDEGKLSQLKAFSQQIEKVGEKEMLILLANASYRLPEIA